MRNLLLKSIFIILAAYTTVSAQLFVGQNSYVYVNDRFVTVTQDINIQNNGVPFNQNGNIYLRNQSQILQKTAVSSTNAGPGKLSVFQEGSATPYTYNYWCSPVGNTLNPSGNENFGITMLNRPTSATASTPATMLSMSTYNGISNPLSISQGWIFKFLSSDLYSEWVGAYSGSTIGPGEGFTMKGTAGTDATFVDAGDDNNPGNRQRYDFRGKPNDGNIVINLAIGKRTLTGNPYPSAIDLKAFLVSATKSTGIAYFWEQDKTVNSHMIAAYRGGYGAYSPVGGPIIAPFGNMGIYTPAVYYAYDGAGTQLVGAVGAGSNYERRFCPIGQGFMLEGAAAAAAPVNATMSNTFRVYQKEGAANYSQFERSNLNPIIRDGIQLETQAEASHFLPEIPSVSGFDYTTVSTDPVPQIRFNTLLNNQGVRQVALAFVHSATDGADFAMDAKSPDTTADTDMYFVIDNEAYVIDVIAFDLNKRIPVGFKSATPALFRIQVGEMLNFSGAANVYLYDKETGLYHDILNKDYEMTLPAGATNRRFEITFLNGMLSIPSLDANSFLIMQNNSAKMLSISNPNEFDLKSVSVFDIGGKLVFNHLNLGNNLNYQFPTATLSDGVYVVKVTTRSNQEFNQKIAVYSGN